MTELGPDEVALAEWSLRGSGVPSIEIVEGLARLQLEVRRSGGRVVLTNVCEELAGLLELAGLSDLSGPHDPLAAAEPDN
ncbi:MAG TPA: hypothetical protein VG650_15970 [Mycobacteriales bacterium]|nr:hypothetical protein [Mycobacteriales bacterium]